MIKLVPLEVPRAGQSSIEVDVPEGWSDSAIWIFVNKYLKDWEYSIPDKIMLIAKTIFPDEEEDRTGLYNILINQEASFNTPVWLNLGVSEKPQCSACFITSVRDELDEIFKNILLSGKIYSNGSGDGTNVSDIREAGAYISGGGLASGPRSFVSINDRMGAVVKSGGKSRRAARMTILDCDHMDIFDFIEDKVIEEIKGRAMQEWDAQHGGKMGWAESGFNGPVAQSLLFQQVNNTVSLTDAFWEAWENGGQDAEFLLRSRQDQNKTIPTTCGAILRAISNALYKVGDPGVHYRDNMKKGNFAPHLGEFRASNPCSEFVHYDDSACNLASINLVKFLDEENNFMSGKFQRVIGVLIRAMDRLVDLASYPSDKITKNSRFFRPLGLGYTNLHSLLIKQGFAYGSEDGRQQAAYITALMTVSAFAHSAELYSENPTEFGGDTTFVANVKKYLEGIIEDFPNLRYHGYESTILNAKGFKNSQVTLLAPTGTISFIMDAETTGIEPAYARTVHKRLLDGTVLTTEVSAIREYLEMMGDKADPDVVKTAKELTWQEHIEMMGAVQPYLTGAISKTVNMPKDITPEEIEEAIIYGHDLGLKSLTVYREFSKLWDVLSDGKSPEEVARDLNPEPIHPVRKKLPDNRPALIQKFDLMGYEGYITTGYYPDTGELGEVFINLSKEGSTLSGFADAFATMVSIALQYGVPFDLLADKFLNARFEPSGMTTIPEIYTASSLVDMIFQYLKKPKVRYYHPNPLDTYDATPEYEFKNYQAEDIDYSDILLCRVCGGQAVRIGKCHTCQTCGESSGCS